MLCLKVSNIKQQKVDICLKNMCILKFTFFVSFHLIKCNYGQVRYDKRYYFEEFTTRGSRFKSVDCTLEINVKKLGVKKINKKHETVIMLF